MVGFHASLKVCKAGLMLVADIAVSCFLKGGNLLEMMAAACDYRSVEDLIRNTQRIFDQKEKDSIQRQQRNLDVGNKRAREEFEFNTGIPDKLIEKMEEAFKSAKIRSTYSGQWKKFKNFGLELLIMIILLNSTYMTLLIHCIPL